MSILINVLYFQLIPILLSIVLQNSSVIVDKFHLYKSRISSNSCKELLPSKRQGKGLVTKPGSPCYPKPGHFGLPKNIYWGLFYGLYWA